MLHVRIQEVKNKINERKEKIRRCNLYIRTWGKLVKELHDMSGDFELEKIKQLVSGVEEKLLTHQTKLAELRKNLKELLVEEKKSTYNI